MINKEKAKIYLKLFQLNKNLNLAVKGFPKEKKYTLGEDILSKNWQCIDLVIAINTYSIDTRKEKIEELSVVFDCLKARLRMAEELGMMSVNQFSHIQENYIREIGKMIGGWMAWAKEK